MMDQNTCFAYLNMELPDDIRRLKEAGYYDAAIARIDACLAEDWTASQNQPLHPQGALPVNPTPHGVDAWRQGLLAHREILRRLPQDYTLTAEQLLNQLQATLRDFTAEEFAALDAAGQMDWRFVEGQKRYIYRAAETLVATHPDLAARQLNAPVPERSWDRFEPQHDQMVRTGAVSADITLRTSIGMTDETFARALAADPEIIYFDEPTSALDPELTGEVLSVMRQLAEEGMTMLVVTHEMGFARNVSSKTVFMENGVVVEQAPSQQFFASPKEERTRAFLRRIAHAE